MKKTSKFLSVFLAILMVISIVPITASAEEITENYDYTVISEEEKTCRLNGDDGISRTDSVVLVIPSEVDGYKVIELADNFEYYSNTQKIVVPDSVEKIGKAFNGKNGLFTIVLGAGVSDFEAKNFNNMNNLKEFIVSEDNPYICSVDGVVFTKDMKTLLRFPTNSKYDTSYEIPDGVEVIGERAFSQGWNLTKVEIPDSVTTIENRAFSACQELFRLFVGKGIKTIEDYAFSNCSKLAEVYCSFPETRLDEITISTKGNANLLNAKFTFDDRDHECEYVFSKVVPPTCLYDGYTLYVCSICGSEYEDNYVPATEEHTIEEIGKTDPTCTEKGYTTYKCVLCNGSYADDYVDKLGHDFEEIATSPDTSECVKNYECTRCGETKTSNGHEKVTIPAKLPTTTEAGNTRGEKCTICGEFLVEPVGIPIIGEDARTGYAGEYIVWVCDDATRILEFYGKGAMSDYDADKSIDNVDDECLWPNYYGIQHIVVHEGITKIGMCAFYDITSLLRITLPSTLEFVSRNAFYDCRKFSVVYAGTQEDWNNKVTVYNVGNSDLNNATFFFSDYDGVTASGVHGDNLTWVYDGLTYTLTISGIGAMKMPLEEYPWEEYKVDIENIVIEYGVTTIARYAFNNFRFKNLTLANSVTSIECAAFAYCNSLENIYYYGTEEQWNNVSIDMTYESFWGKNNFDYATIHFMGADDTEHEHTYKSTVVAPTCTMQGYTKYTCVCGDYYFVDFLDATGHSYSAVLTAPTCTDKGYTTYTCVCGFTYDYDYVNVTGHKDDNSDKYCDSCNEYIGNETGVFADGLVWTYDEETGTLTISGAGAMGGFTNVRPWEKYENDIKVVVINEGITEINDYAFYSCGSIKEVIIHDGLIKIGFGSFENCYELTTITISDSVTEIDNYAFYSCYKLRNVKYSGSIEQWREITIDTYNQPLLNARKHYNTTETHKIEYQLTVINPTCMEQGYTTYTCDCGDSYIDDYIDATGHNYSSEITTPATHTTTGLMTYTCACGDTYTETIDKLAEHNYELVVTPPTCTEQGYTTYTCECGDSYVDDYVNALGHNYSSEITTPATHTTTGVMTYTCACGDSYTEVIEKLEKHNYESVVVAPTCTEQGYATYTCECGDSYVDDYVDALGHIEETVPAVAPTCTETGLTEGTKCSVCGETLTEQKELPANGHTPAKAIEENYVAPTCTENGSKDIVIYCSVCDDELSRETETIEATDHSDNDGDGYCDADNELLDPSVECDHACHSDSFFRALFWKITRFFNKLFGTNKYCECGVAHY